MSALTLRPTPAPSEELALDASLRLRRVPVHRILPSLFDRLCADSMPSVPTVQAQRELLRSLVLRDLQQLLCTVNHERRLDPVHDAPARRSCWNYGVAPLAGELLSTQRWLDIEHDIRNAIRRFEPRIDADSVRVLPLDATPGHARHNVLRFEIIGRIHALPQALAFAVHSSIDLETHRVRLRDAAGEAAVEA